MATLDLKAPFPAFGGKSRVAGIVWPRLSTPRSPARNFIEPFCFSAAMLLLRPDEPKIETINDLNAYVANFWRAVQRDPEAVAAHADWPVNETDLHARHAWLVRSHEAAERLERVRSDPEYSDAKIAGWWCWGACMWIGSGWCEERGAGWAQRPNQDDPLRGVCGDPPISHKLPNLNASDGGTGGKRVHTDAKRPQLCNGNTAHGVGVHADAGPEIKRPSLGNGHNGAAHGVHSQAQDVEDLGWLANKRPRIHGGGGADPPGVHSAMVDAGRPQLADAYSRGRGIHGNDELTDCQRRRLWLVDWFARLADRLRPVRVCCGHWNRVCDSASTLTRLGTTAVFLDPPYRKTLADGTENRAGHIYANDKAQDVNALVDEVQAWCLKWGSDREIRIAVCGLEGEYPDLDAAQWEKVSWKSQGGYGNRNADNQNAARERIWFSPNCVATSQRELFA